MQTAPRRGAREQVPSETLGCRDVAGQSGFASTLTKVNASGKDATTSEVPAASTVSCSVGYLKSQCSGWRPVWITAKLDTARF